MISIGTSAWNNNGISYVEEVEDLSDANMHFIPYIFVDNTTLAMTGYKTNNQWRDNVPDVNWSDTRIMVSVEQQITSGTIAHEVGHAFGLSHCC